MSIIDESYDLNKPFFQHHSYLEWLESFTIDETVPDNRRLTYSKLLYSLWKIPWEGNAKNIGNDADREIDGLCLRDQYESILYGDMMVETKELYGPARVLEVLVSISMHMYDLMLDTSVYNSVSRWFWEIMHNAGLDCLDDDGWRDIDEDVVEEVVIDILQRRSKNGWFSNNNWHEKEVWYQMQEYISDYF